MKFNSFIESLIEKGNSQFSDNQLSTDVIYIDQISHPINNDRRELFYKYAEVKEIIQKFNNIVIGEIANFTEKKSVTHFEYKKGNKKNFVEDQRNILSIAEKIRRNFKRVMSSIEAYQKGADFIVVGRPITKSKDPIKALELFL